MPILAYSAEPYIPTDDDQVLVTLPRELLNSQNELRTLRQQLAADPNNRAIAAEVASQYISLGKSQGDPRFFGYAQAALEPWWEEQEVPPGILALRAELKEADHRFDAALEDLEQLLKQKPDDVQARIEKATLLRLQGKYDEAGAVSNEIADIAGPAQTLVCRVPLMAVTGEAEEAYDELEKLLPAARQAMPGAVQWIVTQQAEIARALGLNEEAEQHYQAGLENTPGDSYLVRAYADFLLDRNRPGEALDLLRDNTSDNGSLLRGAIAARQAGENEIADKWQRQMKNRFEEIRLRGGEPHGRFEARYLLQLEGKPTEALEVALANWQKQKEYRDTRNVLEAALAANDAAAAKPVLEFLDKHQTQDADLQKLVARLEDE